MKNLLSLFLFLLSIPSFAAPQGSFFSQFTGTYQGYDGFWAHPFHASFRIATQGGLPVITSTNISQLQGCDVRVGRYLGSEQEGGKVTATFALQKSASCRVEDDTIRFTFGASARGCSEWSPRIRGSFRLYRYMDGVHHNIPSTRSAYWGLVKQGGC